MNDEVKKMPENEEDWLKKLTPEEYDVLRRKGTEAAFTGEYWATKDKGMYRCKACGQALFSSDAKFDSGTGWPSFDRLEKEDGVKLILDLAYGMNRVEVVCGNCGSHLGHVFDDGPTETGKRYCINSVCLELDKEAAKDQK